jgi:hypothetical protein
MKAFATQKLTLFFRREYTTDSVLKRYARTRKIFDVQAYKDRACTKPYARFMAGTTKPRKGCRYVTVNCFRWHARWLPDLEQ